MLDLLLTDGGVHVWRAFFDEGIECGFSLPEAELSRANRLLRPCDRSRFLFSRIVLRAVLSRYLSVNPGEIVFEVGAHGKPYVPNARLGFNLSHSGDCVLVAVVCDGSVGVDVEKVKSNLDYMGLARRFFSSGECEAIEVSDDPVSAFYYCWTRKEAFLKAHGQGLSFGLNKVEVSVLKSRLGVSDLYSVKDGDCVFSRWFVQSISLGEGVDGYFGAVCITKPVGQIVYYDFSSNIC